MHTDDLLIVLRPELNDWNMLGRTEDEYCSYIPPKIWMGRV